MMRQAVPLFGGHVYHDCRQFVVHRHNEDVAGGWKPYGNTVDAAWVCVYL